MSINMEFRNVVFNAARDGKLRRLKVSSNFRVSDFLEIGVLRYVKFVGV